MLIILALLLAACHHVAGYIEARAGRWPILTKAATISDRASESTILEVNCGHHWYDGKLSQETSGTGTPSAPFRSIARAQEEIRRLRGMNEAAATPITVHISGLCELKGTLDLVGPSDSNVRYVGTSAGAILSGGTRIEVVHNANTGDRMSRTEPIHIDLRKYNMTTDTLGKLSGRGYSGGSACILVNNFEKSATELFYRAPGSQSYAGHRAYGAAQHGGMWVARFPNRAQGGLPSAQDWAEISSVNNVTLTVDSFKSQLSTWRSELASGRQAWMHGLWAWNWADSHRPVLSIQDDKITVGCWSRPSPIVSRWQLTSISPQLSHTDATPPSDHVSFAPIYPPRIVYTPPPPLLQPRLFTQSLTH